MPLPPANPVPICASLTPRLAWDRGCAAVPAKALFHSPCGVVPGRGGGGTPGVPGFLASVGRTRSRSARFSFNLGWRGLRPSLLLMSAFGAAFALEALLACCVSLSASVTVCCLAWEVCLARRSPVPGRSRTWPRKFGLLHAEAGNPLGQWPRLLTCPKTGLSPRGRGTRRLAIGFKGSMRSIPAWAGEPGQIAP